MDGGLKVTVNGLWWIRQSWPAVAQRVSSSVKKDYGDFHLRQNFGGRHYQFRHLHSLQGHSRTAKPATINIYDEHHNRKRAPLL
jgi:hypothetical protein